MPRQSRLGLALLAASILGFTGTAEATSFDLGSVSGPKQLSGMNNKLPGPFTDHFYFTIDPGVTLIFRAWFNAYSFRHWDIADMDGTLGDASGVILNGDAETRYDSGPYPRRLVTFNALTLGPGRYSVSIFGNAFSDVGSGVEYFGTIKLASTPLPAALLMMLTALGPLAWFGWRRKAADPTCRTA